MFCCCYFVVFLLICCASKAIVSLEDERLCIHDEYENLMKIYLLCASHLICGNFLSFYVFIRRVHKEMVDFFLKFIVYWMIWGNKSANISLTNEQFMRPWHNKNELKMNKFKIYSFIEKSFLVLYSYYIKPNGI